MKTHWNWPVWKQLLFICQQMFKHTSVLSLNLSARCCIISKSVRMSWMSIARWGEICLSLSSSRTKCHFNVVALWTWSNRRTTETQRFQPIRTNHARLSANIYTRCGETVFSYKRNIHEHREFSEPLLNISLNS